LGAIYLSKADAANKQFGKNCLIAALCCIGLCVLAYFCYFLFILGYIAMVFALIGVAAGAGALKGALWLAPLLF